MFYLWFYAPQRRIIFLLLGLLGGLAACQTEQNRSGIQVGILPTQAQLAATITPSSTFTPIPLVTLSPTPPAVLPTFTPLPTVLPPSPTPAVVDRTCPDPAPKKPAYNYYHLGQEPWPTPFPNPQPHYWLSKPLPGEGRYLFNKQFPYGYDADGAYLLHNGVDSSGGFGTPLLAVADGVIVYAGPDEEALYGWRCNWYGQLVVLELHEKWLGQPVYALYGHVLGIRVQTGQQVIRGEQVAEVGIGGAALVPHLHFEVRVGENSFKTTQNPALWVEQPETRGAIVGRLVDPAGRPWQGVPISAIDGEKFEHMTWSYLGDEGVHVNPDTMYAENFVFYDLAPGVYELRVLLQGQEYQATAEVVGGSMATVEIITQPAKENWPTPTPRPTNSP